MGAYGKCIGRPYVNRFEKMKQIASTQSRSNYLVLPRKQRLQMLLQSIVEVLFWVYLFYSMLSIQMGIYIPSIAFLLLVALAGISVIAWGRRSVLVNPIVILVSLISLAVVLVQYLFFGVDPGSEEVRAFIIWIPLTMISVGLISREGFIKRWLVAMFILALFFWMSITFVHIGASVLRARADGTSLSNINDYAAWVGFCSLGFWLWGISVDGGKRSQWMFIVSVLAFTMLIQTVSRGSLVALLMGLIVSFRNISRKYWIQLLIGLTIFALVALQFSVFIQAVSAYDVRLYEETGRSLVWLAALNLIKTNPWIGYGVKAVGIYIYSRQRNYTPHNGILYLWFTSGLLPLIPFIVMWFRSLVIAWRNRSVHWIDPLPLLIFVILEMLTSNSYFMSLWSVMTICYVFNMRGQTEKGVPLHDQ